MKTTRRIFLGLSVSLLASTMLVLPVLAMTARSIQVTLGTGATQVSATYAPFSQMTIQNNAAHNIRYGDATVTASKGILLYASGGAGSTGTVSGQQGDASQFYIAGTNGDVIDVLLW